MDSMKPELTTDRGRLQVNGEGLKMPRFLVVRGCLVAALVVTLAGCGASPPTSIATTTPLPSAMQSAHGLASETPTPTAQPQATSGGLPPDGSWQVELTASELVAAGWPADVTPPGTYTWTFTDGRAAIELHADDGSEIYCEADLTAVDDHVRFDYDPAGGDCGATVDSIRWELEEDGLHLTFISTSAPPDTIDQQKAYLETKPWQPTAPAVSTATPGMVDIGERSLFMECRGSGSPTVIFLAGTQVPRGAMRGIEDALLDEGSVRVCDYDRAGEGRSDPAAEPQDDLDVVDDLASLLAAAEIEPPYVLVGHSVGGDQTWLYADRHPEGVAGFMLMNAGFFELDWETLRGVLSDAEIAQAQEDAEAWLGSVKQAATPPDGVPYVVMMSTIAQCGSPTDECGRVYPFFQAWAQELADRTGSGRYVSVPAGHEIYMTQLDRVVEELQMLLDETRVSGAGVPLSYVALGDSLLYALESECDGCTSAATIYGEQMSSDLGVPVDVHNLTMHNSLTSGGLRGYLEDGAQIGRDEEDVLESVAAADAVSVTIGFNDFSAPPFDPTFPLDNFRSNLDAILERINELRDGEPTNLLVTQIYNNGGPAWTSLVEAQNEIICDVAAEHDAQCVDIYNPFNGADGETSPIELGYLGADRTHPSQLGMEVIAEALVAAGYGPLD